MCTVSQASLPADASAILVRIKVPRDSTLKSVMLKTVYGELVLDVTDALNPDGRADLAQDVARLWYIYASVGAGVGVGLGGRGEGRA